MSVAKPSSTMLAVVLPLLAELHSKADCDSFGVGREVLLRILVEVGEKYIAASSSETEIRSFFLGLRVDELALARACAAGNNSAWEIFLTRFREKLYQSALRIAREDSAARELADSLYADLYGTSTREGQRVSKLATYTGRGSLEGWLRTVLAQEYVNRYRRTRRLVSLDEESEEGAQFRAPEAEEVASSDPRLDTAVSEALQQLAAEDRTILAAYFLDDCTLAEIARLLGVHESTISRKVDRLTKQLRKQILAGLGRHGMSRRQAEEALDVDVRDLQLNVRRSLVQDSAPGTFSKKSADTGSQ